MSEKTAELDAAIGKVQTSLTTMQTRVDNIVEALKEKNDSTTAVDLSSEIASLESISASIDSFMPKPDTTETES